MSLRRTVFPAAARLAAASVVLVASLVALLTIAACRGHGPKDRHAGVVVLTASPGYAVERAGLAPGDLLLSWRRGEAEEPEASGGFDSPSEFTRAELEDAPRGAVTIAARRGRQRVEVSLPPGEWRAAVRPAFEPGALARFEAGFTALEAGRAEEAAAAWRDLAAALEEKPAEEPAAAGGTNQHLAGAHWLRLRAAAALAEAGEVDAAGERFEAEVKPPEAGPASPAAWQTWLAWGDLLEPTPGAPAALDAYSQGLGALPAGGTSGLDTPGADSESATRLGLVRAALLHRRGWMEFRRGRWGDALETFGEARSLWRRHAPESAPEAVTLVMMGVCQSRMGEYPAAGESQAEALRIAQALDPRGHVAARAAQFLGEVADREGRLGDAARLYRQALGLYRELGIRDLEAGIAHMGSGILAWRRGDLEAAEQSYRPALRIFENEPTGRVYVAWALQNLGLVHQDRRDLASAEEYLLRSLELRRARNHRNPGVVTALNNLASLALEQGEPERARTYLAEGLGIIEELEHGAEHRAYVVANLGRVALAEGRLEEAEEHLRDSVAVGAPESFEHAERFIDLGEVLIRQGRLAEAEEPLRGSLAVSQAWAPGTPNEAMALAALARVCQGTGRQAEALAHLERAVEALEEQSARLGGPGEARSLLVDRYAAIYKQLISLLLELGREEDAFHLLERYRAQGLRAMLAARELTLDSELPAALTARRRQLGARYEEAQERLRGLAGRDGGEDAAAREARAALLALRRERAALEEEVLAAAPRLAALESPRAVTAAEAAGALGEGTHLLSYCVLPGETLIFSLAGGTGDLRVFRSGSGEAGLREHAEAFHDALAAPGGAGDPEAIRALGRKLDEALLAPARERLAGASRLLLIPDVPLHGLPFAALVSPEGRFLVEDAAVHTAASMTVYRQLQGPPTAGDGEASATLVAFGDPAGARGPAAGELPALPAARAEVAALARLFPESEAFLGAEATESRAKEVNPEARFLHFACHGFFDHRFPLDSYLALAPFEGGADNGRLQAWEIFEQLRIEADLVTLSACDSGRGRELAGEGLVGLTRAFQFAGARSVLASLWGVADGSTAALMARFYEHLNAGLGKAEALRAAQLELLRGEVEAMPVPAAGGWLRSVQALFLPEEPPQPATHPFYWAAFQLVGEGG